MLAPAFVRVTGVVTATASTGPARWRRRPTAVVLAIATIVLTLAIATAMRPVRLTEVLLLVLVEVVAVSLVAGRTVAAVTAVSSVVAVNWLLVPPYGTLVIANPENWVSLGVFLLLAVGVSSLVESVLASERRAVAGAAREAALAEVLRPEQATATESLAVLRAALHLDDVQIVAPDGDRLGADPAGPTGQPSLDIGVTPGFRVLGWGPELFGAQPDYVSSLATAAVRAWESERLVAEQERSARLAELDAARAALIASIGHDLRTPLTGIRVSADALAMAGDDLPAEDRQALLDSLRSSAVRLDGLLDDVLESARIESGVAVPDARPADLRDLAERVAAEHASPRIQVHVPGEPVVALVDAVVAERILSNLVSNALLHTPPGSPVELVVGADPGEPRIDVVDHGPGLAPRGTTADSGRQRHGMGLLIVERLARFAGIAIDMASTPGGGLTVALRFPAEA